MKALVLIPLVALAACVTSETAEGVVFPFQLSKLNPGLPETRYYVDLGDRIGRSDRRGIIFEAAAGVVSINGSWDAARIAFRPALSGEEEIRATATKMCAAADRRPSTLTFGDGTFGNRVANFACV